MAVRSNAPCDIDGICPYAAEGYATCEYWCGTQDDDSAYYDDCGGDTPEENDPDY